MSRTAIDVEKTIERYLSRSNNGNIEKAFYYKIDELGNITKKEGYAVKNTFTSNKRSTVFLDKNAPDISKLKVTISKCPGEVYRNSVWFPIDQNTEEELFIKAIDLFQQNKSDQLIKLQTQVSDIKNVCTDLMF